jgi:tubulin--tyrosine ligase
MGFVKLFCRGMADRGMGIRLFRTKDDLQNILESFGEDSDTETDENLNATAIVASQLRHFVIQVLSSSFAIPQM